MEAVEKNFNPEIVEMTYFVRITREYWVEVEPGETATAAYDRANKLDCAAELIPDSTYTNIVDGDGEIVPDGELG